MAADSLQRDQVVFHKTFGPGRIVSASPVTIEVEFHDGRREPFRRNYAREALYACNDDGFSARLLADKRAVLRALEEDPREVFKWLSRDLHRDVTARTAKPLLKALNILSAEALEATWRRATRKLQSQPPKRRLADDTLRISDEEEARKLEGKLWDTEIHILSRNRIFKALSAFHELRSDENFFLRALFCPVPVARGQAYGFFKKGGELQKVWDYLIRKSVDQKSALGMLDVWFRLIGDSGPEEFRAYGKRAVDIFLQLQTALPLKGDRLDNVRKLLAPQTGGASSFCKAAVARLPRQTWEDVLPELSAEEKRGAFRLYYQGAVFESEEGSAVDALSNFFSRFDVESLPDLAVMVVDFAKSAGRTSFARKFLRRSSEVIARQPEIHETGLARLRDWLVDHRDLLDDDLARVFSKLGYPIEDRPAQLDRAGHVRRLEDPSFPLPLRERSLEHVAAELSGHEVANLARKLTSEHGSDGQRLLGGVWSRWARSRETPELVDVLLTVLLGEDGGEAVRIWALARVDESGALERLADVLCRRIEGRSIGEPLEPELRGLLAGVKGHPLGHIVRDNLLKARSRIEGHEGPGTPHGIGDALTLLGVDSDLYTFIENVLDASRREVDALTAAVRSLEDKLEDILSSAEVEGEIRRRVDESLGAREAQLREEWDRRLETTRLDIANFYLDLAALVHSVRSRLGEDSGAVADILTRRLEQLLSSRLDMAIVGRIGDTVRFDPDLHQSAAGRIVEGDEVTVLRPGIQRVGSGGALIKSVVKRP